jgi:hypothetical protein
MKRFNRRFSSLSASIRGSSGSSNEASTGARLTYTRISGVLRSRQEASASSNSHSVPVTRPPESFPLNRATGSGTPTRDQRITTTTSVSDGGTIVAWKCSPAVTGSHSQSTGSTVKASANCRASTLMICSALRRSGWTSLGDETKIRTGRRSLI